MYAGKMPVPCSGEDFDDAHSPAQSASAVTGRPSRRDWSRCRDRVDSPWRYRRTSGGGRIRAPRAGYDWTHPSNGTSIMCYSAQITADYRKYVHVYGADIDIDEFVRLFWDRRSGSKSKIPKAMEAPFLTPQNDVENRIKESITAFSAEQTAKLEQDLFKQRTRLADAERTRLTKTTKAASESNRIATDKIDWIRSKLEDFTLACPQPCVFHEFRSAGERPLAPSIFATTPRGADYCRVNGE